MVKKTTHWRVEKELANDLKIKFPGVSQPALFRIMYNSSLLRAESRLRKRK